MNPSHHSPAGRALALGALAAASFGCMANTGFTVDRRIFVDETAGQDEPAVAVLPVDLSASGDAWINRRQLEGVSLGKVSAAIVAVDSGNAASHASGTLALRAEGGPADGSLDVMLGSFADMAVQPGSPIEVTARPEAAALIERALEGTGRFSLVVRSAADARPAGFAVGVTLQVRVRYRSLRVV